MTVQTRDLSGRTVSQAIELTIDREKFPQWTHELESNTTKLVEWNETIVAGTHSGLFVRDESGWTQLTQERVYNLDVDPNSALRFSSVDGIYLLSKDSTVAKIVESSDPILSFAGDLVEGKVIVTRNSARLISASRSFEFPCPLDLSKEEKDLAILSDDSGALQLFTNYRKFNLNKPESCAVDFLPYVYKGEERNFYEVDSQNDAFFMIPGKILQAKDLNRDTHYRQTKALFVGKEFEAASFLETSDWAFLLGYKALFMINQKNSQVLTFNEKTQGFENGTPVAKYETLVVTKQGQVFIAGKNGIVSAHLPFLNGAN